MWGFFVHCKSNNFIHLDMFSFFNFWVKLSLQWVNAASQSTIIFLIHCRCSWSRLGSKIFHELKYFRRNIYVKYWHYACKVILIFTADTEMTQCQNLNLHLAMKRLTAAKTFVTTQYSELSFNSLKKFFSALCVHILSINNWLLQTEGNFLLVNFYLLFLFSDSWWWPDLTMTSLVVKPMIVFYRKIFINQDLWS